MDKVKRKMSKVKELPEELIQENLELIKINAKAISSTKFGKPKGTFKFKHKTLDI